MKFLVIFATLFAVFASAYRGYFNRILSLSFPPRPGQKIGGPGEKFITNPPELDQTTTIKPNLEECYRSCEKNFGESNSNSFFADSLVNHCFQRTC